MSQSEKPWEEKPWPDMKPLPSFGVKIFTDTIELVRALNELGCDVRLNGPLGGVSEIVLPPDQPELQPEEPWST